MTKSIHTTTKHFSRCTSSEGLHSLISHVEVNDSDSFEFPQHSTQLNVEYLLAVG